jgi:glycerol-3-phosphate dehydrogenase
VSSWLEKGYYGIGLWLYDRLSYPHHLQATRWLSEKGLYKRIPGLRSGYSGGWVYWDGQFVDRLYAVHLALFLRQRFGVVIHTHARVVSIQPHERYVAVQATLSDGSIYETAGDYVVNATGPWADEIRAMVRPNATPRLRLSRGSHWVLPRRALPLEAGFLVPRTEDGRLLFVLPWLEDTVLVGTTDVEASKPAWPARVSDEEEAFLDAHLRKYFDLRGERKVLARFAGYRPLVAQKVGSTARLARSHVVEVWPEARFVSLMGGKWTTFRKMGEDALGQLTKACRVSLPAGEVVDSIVPDWTLLEKCRSAYPEPIVSGLPYTWGEVVFWQELGWAQEPEDLVSGRWLLPYIDEEKAAIVRKALTVKWRTASVS